MSGIVSCLLRDELDGSFLSRANYGCVNNLLPDATDLQGQGACDPFTRFQTMDQILHRILIR